MNEPQTSDRAAATLHLLTGAWGSGKTSLIPHLVPLVPQAVVFDWDALLPGLSAAAGKDAHHDPSTWEGLRTMWIAIVESVLAGGRDVVLCGPATPGDFVRSGIAAESIRCAYLDLPDEVLAGRLRSRREREQDVADELASMAALRASAHTPLPVDGLDPREVAGRVAAWVRAVRAQSDAAG
ncbi:MAG TPA: AAA family ATPase [Longimicrobium sp.]|nr:AAA family ATPase [Longimicrobium sp.]